MELTDDQYYADVNYYSGAIQARSRSIDFIDPAPKPFIVQIPLVEYFERITKLKTDRWQKHFLNYLQNAVENMHIKPSWDEFHAEPQLGKTRGLSQVFPSWCFGHAPLFRYTLAMYNISRSTAHADVIIQIMRSPLYQEIFPNQDSHLPKHASKEGFMTNARRDVEGGRMDAQKSLNPVGLESGMTGSGTDWLTIDDPYKEPKDAFSETVWDNLDRFWKYGVAPRLLPHTCIAAMFHRYSYDDLGGYLLNTGKFNYVRYATIADGAYFHDETGQKFEDPLDRKIGEYICPERRTASYYQDKQEDGKVWLSMFQGRPGREEGDFFQVDKIEVITDGLRMSAEWAACALRARGWDHAATQGSGDQSAGGLVGLQADGTVIIPDVFSGQLDSAKRVEKQREIAEGDGTDTTVVVPEGVGADGKDVVFLMRQNLQDFNVVARKVTNASPGSDAKKRRAYNFSIAVNSGKVKFFDGAWVERVKRLMRRFGNSTSGDDEIDALSDAYNHLYEALHTGLVVKNFSPQRNLRASAPIEPHWTVYAGVKVTPESNTANSGVIVARAPKSTGLDETLFVLAEYKEFTSDFYKLFQWLNDSLKELCPKNEVLVWLHKDSADFAQTITRKIGRSVILFKEDGFAGLTEMNWYMQGHLVGFVEADQLAIARDAKGLISMRQEAATWGYLPSGEPSAVGAVLDCLSMIAYKFRTTATPLTFHEELNKKVASHTVFAREMAGDTSTSAQISRSMAVAKGLKELKDEGWEVDDQGIETERDFLVPLTDGW